MHPLITVGCLAALANSIGPVFADNDAMLQPGAYEVQVRLELPNLSDNTAVKVSKICVGRVRGREGDGLAVLSDNNPLSNCPHSNARSQGNVLTFDIVCPGGDAARASARFRIGARRFEGRIAMKMGGKNMTMTEVQSGRWVGTCSEGAPSAN